MGLKSATLQQPPKPPPPQLQTLAGNSNAYLPPLETARQKHLDLIAKLECKHVTLHVILLGAGGTIYKGHTIEPLQALGLDKHRALALAKILHIHSVKYVTKDHSNPTGPGLCWPRGQQSQRPTLALPNLR